jgi:hypothetical protein
MKWNWKDARPDWGFFDLLLIIGAVVAGFGIWFIPSWSSTPGFKKLEAAVHERIELNNKIKAEEVRIKKKNDEEGIVYFGPGGVPLPPEPVKGKTPPKPPAHSQN